MFSTTNIVDTVVAAIFALILPFGIFGLVCRSTGRKVAYVMLCVFAQAQLVGNVLLVAASQATSASPTTTSNLYTAGFILSNVGFSLLISAGLCLYNSALGIVESKKGVGLRREGGGVIGLLSNPSRLLHTLNLVATILLVTGLTDSDSILNAAALGGVASTAQLDSKAKIGYVLYLVVTVLFLLLCLYRHIASSYGTHHQGEKGVAASRLTLLFTFMALLPMLVRVIYSLQQGYRKDFLEYNLYVRLVLQHIMDMLAASILIASGYVLHAKGLLVPSLPSTTPV